MINQDDLKNLFGAMFSSIEKKNIESAEAMESLPVVLDALAHLREGDVTRFYFGLIYPINNAVEGLIAKEFSSREARFLVMNSTFVEENFKSLIVKYEGSACSADKSRTIMRALLKFYVSGKEIVFDHSQEYTYHLPKNVFTTHAEIVEFFDGLYRLYYGKSDSYMRAIINVHKSGLAAQSKQIEQIQPDGLEPRKTGSDESSGNA